MLLRYHYCNADKLIFEWPIIKQETAAAHNRSTSFVDGICWWYFHHHSKAYIPLRWSRSFGARYVCKLKTQMIFEGHL
jgi:hypothetical protein